MDTTIRKTIVAGALTGFAALLVAAPASARLPEGGKADSFAPRHFAAVVATNAFRANTPHATGCGKGIILGRPGGDDDYEYYGDHCGSWGAVARVGNKSSGAPP